MWMDAFLLELYRLPYAFLDVWRNCSGGSKSLHRYHGVRIIGFCQLDYGEVSGCHHSVHQAY